MTYEITFDRRSGIKTTITNSTKVLADSRKEAHDYAAQCLPWEKIPADIKHLVYYYELKATDVAKKIDGVDVQVTALFDPRGLTDEEFYSFVDYWKPLYVGAIHRHA